MVYETIRICSRDLEPSGGCMLLLRIGYEWTCSKRPGSEVVLDHRDPEQELMCF